MSEARDVNLVVLSAIRRSYFRDKLNPALIGTRLAYISEDNRIPAVVAVLPLVLPQPRAVLERAISEQTGSAWDLGRNQSPWNLLRGPFDYGLGMAEIDDLTGLEYGRFFDAVAVPEDVDPDRFLGSIEDFLVNDFSILEALRLVAEAESARLREAPQAPGPIRQVLNYNDLRMHLHLGTAVVRLRAGWDKIVNNVLHQWFGPRADSHWPDRWGPRINRLDERIRRYGPDAIRLWRDLQSNGLAIAESGGLRDIRDRDLHYWSQRTRETFGSRPGEWQLSDLKALAIEEQARLADAWLLTMALVRVSSPLKLVDPSP